MLYLEAAFEVPDPLNVRVLRRQCLEAEIRGQRGEVDLAAGTEIDTAAFALRDIVLVQIRPRQRGGGDGERVVALGS